GSGRSRRARERPCERARPRAWVRSTRAASARSDPRPRRAAPSRCSAARAWSAAQPAALLSFHSRDRPPAEQPSCEARGALQAGRCPGAGARALAPLSLGWRAGRGRWWDRGPAFAERSGWRAPAACPASSPTRHGVAEEPCPRARDELVRAPRVGVAGVVVQDLVRAPTRRPLTDDQQVAGVVEVLDQFVREVAVEPGHVAPDRLGDPATLLRRLGRKVRLPHGMDRHRCPPWMSLRLTVKTMIDRYCRVRSDRADVHALSTVTGGASLSSHKGNLR